MPATHYSILSYVALSTDELIARAKTVGASASDRRGKNEGRRRSYFAGRAAIAALFNENKIKATVVAHPSLGYLMAHNTDAAVFINVSHTQEIAVAAVSRFPVGIDIESSQRSAERVLSRVAHPSELIHDHQHLIPTLSGSLPFGIALWSAKEAFSKALGLGIKFGMQELRVSLQGENPFPATTTLKGPFPLQSPAVVLERHEDYVIALCSEREALLGLSRLLL